MAWSREIDSFAREYYAGRTVAPGDRSADYYWHRKRLLILDLIRAHFRDFGPTPTFVDLGCGDGLDLAPVAVYANRRVVREQPDAPLWRFLGIEGYPPSIKAFHELIAAKGIANAELRIANITKRLPLADGEADVLYCSEVLEHIPDLEAMLAEFHRVVRPGGFVLMTTPNQPNVFQRSYWSRDYDRRQREKMDRVVHRGVEIAGETVDLYGHISLHRNAQWDEMFQRRGFRCVDFRRGAATYGAHRFLNKTPYFQLRMMFERALDLLPRALTRNLSDQVIALYRRDA